MGFAPVFSSQKQVPEKQIIVEGDLKKLQNQGDNMNSNLCSNGPTAILVTNSKSLLKILDLLLGEAGQ